MRKTIFGLLRSSGPVLLTTVLVAVVGVTGTAYAGNHNSGNDKHGNNNSHGDKGNNNGHYDFSDHSGKKKHKGDRGAAYGVATISVARGGGNASVWATYSTRLGSPVGDNTGGVFRFTCSATPCTISVAAAVLGSSDHAVYPRLLVYKQGDGNGGGTLMENYCEYADGSTDALPLPLAHQSVSASPIAYTAVPVNIGGSADCGSAPAVPISAANKGNEPYLTVPVGYYDVHSTFVFAP